MKTFALAASRAIRSPVVITCHLQRNRSVLAVATIVLMSTAANAQNPFDGGAGANPFDNSGGVVAGNDAAGSGRNLVAEAEQRRRFAEEKDPVVLAVRDSKPTTSQEVTRAMQVMMGIGRYDEAERYLQALDQGNVPESELAALLNEFGSAFFLKVLRRPELAPRGRLFAEAVFGASAKITYDPARIAQQIGKLTNASERVRQTAISELRIVGAQAINPLLSVLLDDQRRDEHVAVQGALMQMGDVVTEPLIAALSADNEVFRLQIMHVLGVSQERQAVPFLAGRAYASQLSQVERDAAQRAVERIIGSLPSQQQVEAYLTRKANSYLEDRFVGVTNERNEVAIWSWNATEQRVAKLVVPASDAAAFAAADFCQMLYAIVPKNSEYRRLYLIAALMRDKVLGGIEWPLDPQASPAMQFALQLEEPVLEDALAYALRKGYVGGAIGIVEVLRETGSEGLLVGASISPLASCLKHSSRRLRFAAMEAILRINPQQGFPGSSFLTDTLSYLTNTSGLPRVLVAHPSAERARTIVGMLVQIGFEGDVAITGNDVVRLAQRNPDYEFILVSDAINDPGVTRLLEQLRGNITSADTPVAILARASRYERAKDLANRYLQTEAFPFNASIGPRAAYEVHLTSRGEDMTRFEDVINQVRDRDEFQNMGLRVTTTGRRFIDARFLARNDPLLEASDLIVDPSSFRNVNYQVTIIGDATPLTTLLEYLQSTSPARQLELRVDGSTRTLEQIANGKNTRDVIATEMLSDLVRVSAMITRLRDVAVQSYVSQDERLRHAGRCLEWFGRLSESPKRYAYYDLVRHQQAVENALNTPALLGQATYVLGNFATPSAQKTLVELASQNTRPIAERQAAADAFREAVDRSGILLTTSEILLQYQRYNSSAKLEKETQQVLGHVLDTIESPSNKAASQPSAASN